MEDILDDVRRDAIIKLRTSEGGERVLAETAELIINLSEMARTQGLSCLKEKAEHAGSGLLKLAVSAVVDTCSPEFVTEILSNAYWADEPEGVQAMVYYIYLRGMLCIQRGDPPQIIQEIIQSLMPVELRKGFKRKMESKRQCRKELEEESSRICPVFQDAGTLKKVHMLERIVYFLRGRDLQRALMDVDVNDLAVCVYAVDPETREKILDNISRRYAALIMDQVVHCYKTQFDEGKVFKSTTLMIRHMKQIDRSGEIILYDQERLEQMQEG